MKRVKKLMCKVMKGRRTHRQRLTKSDESLVCIYGKICFATPSDSKLKFEILLDLIFFLKSEGFIS